MNTSTADFVHTSRLSQIDDRCAYFVREGRISSQVEARVRDNSYSYTFEFVESPPLLLPRRPQMWCLQRLMSSLMSVAVDIRASKSSGFIGKLLHKSSNDARKASLRSLLVSLGSEYEALNALVVEMEPSVGGSILPGTTSLTETAGIQGAMRDISETPVGSKSSGCPSSPGDPTPGLLL